MHYLMLALRAKTEGLSSQNPAFQALFSQGPGSVEMALTR